MDTTIRFRSQGMQEIQSEALALMSSLIAKSNSYNKSGKETLDILKSEIALYDQMQKSSNKQSVLDLERSKAEGSISDKDYHSEKQELKEDRKIQGIQVEVLKQILAQLVQTSKTEAFNDDQTEKLISDLDEYLGRDEQGRGVRELVNKLKSDSQKEDVEPVSKKSDEDRKNDIAEFIKRFSITNVLNPISSLRTTSATQVGVGVASNLSDAAMQSGNIYLAVAGLVGKAISWAVGEWEETRNTNEEAAKTSIQQWGGETGNYVSTFRNDNYLDPYYSKSARLEMGVSYLDAITRRSELASSFGKRPSEQQTIDALALERGLGINPGVVGEIAKLGRGSAQDPMKEVLRMMNSMGLSGMSKLGDFSLLGENLGLLVDLSKRQLEATGRVDMGINTKIIGAFAKMDNSFKNPEVLRGVIDKFSGGLSKASTPQMEALQMLSLNQLHPNASLRDLEIIRSNPLAHPEYLEKVMSNLSRFTGGNRESFGRSLDMMFGFNAEQSNLIARKYLAGDKNWITNFKIDDTSSRGEGSFGLKSDIYNRAKRSTTSRVRQVAGQLEAFQDFFGEKAGVSKTIDEVNVNEESYRRAIGNLPENSLAKAIGTKQLAKDIATELSKAYTQNTTKIVKATVDEMRSRPGNPFK